MKRFSLGQQQALLLVAGAILLIQAVRLLPLPAPSEPAFRPSPVQAVSATHSGSPKARTPSQSEFYLSGLALDLNRAEPEELDLLPGIGAKRTAAIIALRERTGGLTSLDQLASIRGFHPGLIRQLKGLAVCGPLPRP